ncbi:MAG TPA: phage tail sheath C-terminal domain-containing protein, partial [Polyangiaceae bacterium]|nr:phage tail sheath C-terminal domain-containing protein [Polyangiaceae bacterium]
LLSFKEQFGGWQATELSVSDENVPPAPSSKLPGELLWYALNLYFNNGGGRCYVASIGEFPEGAPREADYAAGLDALAAFDEPTLVVAPGAVQLAPADYAAFCQKALAHCKTLKDRFAVLDIKDGPKAVEDFRTGVGTDGLSYGAAYYPYLETTLLHEFDEAEIKVGTGAETLASIRVTKTAAYNAIKKSLGAQRVLLPPSAAVVGAYCRVDRERGVWKAPANVSLSSVIQPAVRVTSDAQETLNVDTNAGKSINVIRAFAGKGSLVWGGRTLAGNDNEWRYVNVRRLFITIEESAKNATGFAVFEPNDATTWLKVKGMLEAYLYGLWERGALQGAKPEQAFVVNVGLGKTMTQQDILEGRLVVELSIAAVRPAEFITLRFSHKLAES